MRSVPFCACWTRLDYVAQQLQTWGNAFFLFPKLVFNNFVFANGQETLRCDAVHADSQLGGGRGCEALLPAPARYYRYTDAPVAVCVTGPLRRVQLEVAWAEREPRAGSWKAALSA